MRQAVNEGIGMERASLQFTRYDVLALLWRNAAWLDKQIHKKQLKISNALKQRVYMVQVQSGVCKALIYGLKDEELELRVKELEETIRKGVVIPVEQESTKANKRH